MIVLGEHGYLGSVVKRRWAERGDPGDYIVNCIRPDDILRSERLAETGRLIQPSTDAIAEDSDYARTKRILERLPGAVVIRAGIVDIRQDYGIAYRNWLCNPLTPLEWADLAYDLRDRPGLHVTGRERLTRYEVVRSVAEVWDRPAPVAAWAEATLSRIQTPGDWPPLRDALVEFAAWLQS